MPDLPAIDGRILLTTPTPGGQFIDVQITGTQVYALAGESGEVTLLRSL